MKRLGNRIISIILAVILLFSLSGNVLTESGTLYASRAFAAENENTAETSEEASQKAYSDEESDHDDPETAEAGETGEVSIPEEDPEEPAPEVTEEKQKEPEEGGQEEETAEEKQEEAQPSENETTEAEQEEEQEAGEQEEEAQTQPQEQADAPEEDESGTEQEADDAGRNTESAEESDDELAEDDSDVTATDVTAKKRTIIAQTYETVLYDEHGDTTVYIDRINAFWNWLFDRIPLTARDHDPEEYEPVEGEVTVEVTGVLPADVTAAAYFTTMAEEGIYSEKALMALDLELRDAKGSLYVPQEELTISVGGYVVGSAIAQEKALLVYDYRVNAARQKRLDEYALDVRVIRDGLVDEDRLRYRGEKGDSEAVLFTEDEDELAEYEDDGTFRFKAEQMPLNLIIAEQVRERTLSASTQDGATDIELNGALSESTSAYFSVSYADQIREQTDGAGLVGVDISLEDPEAGTYSPEVPLEVAITDASIGEALERESELEVWQMDGAEGPGKVEDAEFHGNTAQFQADGGMSYVVVETYLEKTLETTDGDVYKISVSYDHNSGIPANAELNAEEIKEGGAGYDNYVKKAAAALGEKPENLAFARAFDITLKNLATGEVCQPNEKVQVKIQLLKDDLNSYDSVDVVHIHGKDEKQADIIKSNVRGESVEFETDGFSVYVLTAETYLGTYHFYSYNRFGEYQGYNFYDDQGNLVTSQTIKNGEKLLAPHDPINPNETSAEFKGWYLGTGEPSNPDLEDTAFDFNKPQDISSNETFNLYAVFSKHAHVTFHSQYDSASQTYPVLDIMPVELLSDTVTVDVSGVSAPYHSTSGSSHYEFYGWSETPFQTPGEGTGEIISNPQDFEVSGDRDLYPVYKQVHYLTLASGFTGTSATYFSPVAVPAGERLMQSDIKSKYIPERPGYTFQGWYLDVENAGTDQQNGTGTQVTTEDGTLLTLNTSEIQAVEGTDGYLLLATDVTLYAKWQAKNVDYNIVVWRQRKTDEAGLADENKTWDFAERFVLQAQPSASVTVGEAYKQLEDDNKYNSVHDEEHQIEEGGTNPYTAYTFGRVTTGSGKDEKPAAATAEQQVEFKGTTVFNLYYNYTGSRETPTTAEHTITRVYGSESFNEIKATAGTALSTLELGTTAETKKGHTFAWYLDSSCTKAIDNTATMPDHDLTIYGKWSIKRITIHIDTDYGALYGLEGASGTGSTYYNLDYGESIAEYSHVTREYVPSESGNYYYVNHDWNGSYSDRHTYYTTDISKATELTTFKSAPGTYFAEGWYVQEPDGSETLFDFNNQSTYNFEEHLVNDVFTLKLHWKMAGTYYLQYNTDITLHGKRLRGTLSDDSIQPNPDGYRDQASITIGGRAIAPDEYAFVGWTVRGDDSRKVYFPGETLTLPGKYAVTVNGKKTVYLDAVYQQIRTAKIVYDANGGTISDSADSGYPYEIDSSGNTVFDDDQKPKNLNTHKVTRDTEANTVTVSGFMNNSPVKLSSGDGFTAPADSKAILTGWNTKADGSGDHYDLDAYQKGNKPIYVDVNDPVTLYAEWQITVFFNKNEDHYPGASFSPDGWDGYTLVDESASEHPGDYSIVTYVNAVLSEPQGTVETDNGQAFDFWSTMREGNQTYAYDFNDPLSGELTLYAHLTDAVKIPYHVVSTNKVVWDTWRNTDTLDLTVIPIDLSLGTEDLSSYVTPEETGYTYAYACLSDSAANISEDSKITAAKIVDESGSKVVKVTSADDISSGEYTNIPEGKQIYLVYATGDAGNRVKLAYVKEGEGGVLTTFVGSDGAGITYNGAEFTSLNTSLVDAVLSSATVANGSIEGDTTTGQVLTLSDTELEISQRYAQGVFNAPPLLDDGTDPLALVFSDFGVSKELSEPVSNIDAIAKSAKKLYLRYYEGKRQWSGDKTSWTTFTGDTLYVVYRPRGVELEITKAVTGDNTGISPDESFSLEVTSNAIIRTSYSVEGTGYSTVSATPASGDTPGSIRLTVKDGSDIKISGLGSGTYTITETHNSNYTLNARIDDTAADVTNDTSVTVTLDQSRKLDLLNIPQVICRIQKPTGGYQQFYTLNSALNYAGTEKDGEAEIQMLRDYVIPDWDVLEIPTGYEITITSANAQTKTITKDAAVDSPMLTNYGTLSLENIIFDGAGAASRYAMVRNVGELTVGDGATFSSAAMTAGSGSAIYQTQGILTIEEGASFAGNTAADGGAIYVYSGIVAINGGDFSSNTASGNGGVMYYAGNDTITISGGTFNNNNASGNGGAIYASGGSMTISGGTFGGGDDSDANHAANGGAVYLDSGTVSVSDGAVISGNTAEQDGGAIYSGSGAVSVSGGTLSSNSAAGGNGGAICSDAGTVSISDGTISGNNAANGNGGAVYIGSGSLELSGGTIGGSDTDTANSAKNGAGVFVNSGTGTFSGGSVTGNTATAGGAVGAGSTDTRLTFSGNVTISDNTMGTDDSNVYLDQDSDDVLNFAGLGGSAAVGVYVADSLIANRGIPGATFAAYTDDTNKAKIANDRDDFDVVSETSTKKLYWGNAISVVVRYQPKPFATNGFPPRDTDPQFKKTINPYYPVMGEDGYVALSALAEDIYNTYDLGLTATAAYAGAYLRETPVVSSFEDYFTKLSWSQTEGGWKLAKHDGNTEISLGNNTLVIYYAEPAYISIENNTDTKLTISSLDVGEKSVINTTSVAGYGMVFAKNGAIRSALLPVESDDLILAAGKSVNLLIPGGRDVVYNLNGSFVGTGTEQQVQLRTTNAAATGYDSTKLAVAADGSFTFPTGKKTLNKAGTYQIIFGDDKKICKIYTPVIANVDEADRLLESDPDAEGKVEYVFKSLNQAIAFVQKYMQREKTATIEMLTDYLLPASDNMNIPQGYNITLTTATTGSFKYTATEKYSQKENKIVTESRVTISRDSDNKVSMFTVTKGNESTFFTLENLIIDGKSVQGSSDGGAVSTDNCGVTVNNADFLNVYAGNGGAIYAKTDMGKSNSWVHVENSYFYKCNSTKATGNRLGGGAIHAFVNDLTVTNSDFYSCKAADQAGAVFHRIDGNVTSSATITGCTFSDCRAKAAGGLELDSKTIIVRDCTFEHCVATERNGGGFNVYALNNANPTQDCWVTVTGCSFEDCNATNLGNGDRYGGAFRSNSVYTTAENCTFNNTSALRGGSIGISNTNAKQAVIRGCKIENGKASQYGGGIYCSALELTIEDGYYYKDSDSKKHTVHKYGDSYKDLSGNLITDEDILEKIESAQTEIKNCKAGTVGGGIHHSRNAENSFLNMSHAILSGNNAGTTGGGIDVINVRSVTITGSTIQNNTAGGNGGGIRFDSNNDSRRLILDQSTVQGNVSGGQGGGIYANSQITLRNDTVITENHLTGKTAENAAGVYAGRRLTIGTEGASTDDATTVKDNTTGANAASDVRLITSGSNNASNSVNVLCNLNGEIRVVNPGAAGTQFGTRANNSITGFTEGKHVFVADSGGLYGVYNRNSDLQLIWRGGVVCKLTDENGHLLYLDEACTDPAVFDRLDDRTNGNKLSPFSYLRQNTANVKLYRQGETSPIDLKAEGIQVKMLVSTFETGTNIQTGTYTDRKLVTITTASSTDTDGYPYTGRAGSYARIIRGYGSNYNNLPLINTGINLTLRNITLDGGAADKVSPKTTTSSGGLVYANVGNTTITLGANAVLQNVRISNANHGGGVYLNNGASLIIAGGAIYNCSTASGQGGGVYKTGNGGSVTFSSGIISRCSAKQGGGVCFVNGSGLNMSGTAQITGCTATEEGGGVYLWEQRTMNMTGGSITGNHAGTAGGGIFLSYHKNSRLKLSGRVTISGNTAGADEYACNVQLGTKDNNPSNINEWNGIINSLGIARNSLIGIYVPGEESPGDNPLDKNTTVFDRHGLKTKPFGTFTGDTDHLYCFVNDRNGLKGGLQVGDLTYIHWVEIFSLKVAKTVISGEAYDLTEEFKFKVTFSLSKDGPAYYDFDSSDPAYSNCYFTYDNRTDSEGHPITVPIVHGVAEFNLKNGESITVDNLPAEINNGSVYYKVEELLTSEQEAHYTTTTSRSTNPSASDVESVSGTVGENLHKENVTSKYVSNAFFDNLNAICKLTSSANGGILLNTLDTESGHYVPAIYSDLHSTENTGAFDVINDSTPLYYWNSFTNRYEQFDYDGNDALRVEMLVEEYEIRKNEQVSLINGKAVTLTTAKPNASDGYPYVGKGTTATISRAGDLGNFSMFTSNGSLTLAGIILDGNNKNVDITGGIVKVPAGGSLTVASGAELKNSKTKKNGGAIFVEGTMNMTGGTITGNTTTGYGGGAIRMEGNAANVSISGGVISGNTVQNNDANGGAISVRGGTLTVSGGTISGNTAKGGSTKAVGGAIYVHSSATATISGGTIIGNMVINSSQLNQGGAVYVDGGKLTLTGGTFKGNTATTGAGIYLAGNAVMSLSGQPTFGAGEEANTVVIDNYEDLKNGNEFVYVGNKVRQDIYVTETGDNPASIVISGDLTGVEGSIWVWAESDKHNMTMTPFAKIDSSKVTITDDNRETVSEMFKVFRNALPDNYTNNPLSQTPPYLYGVLKPDDNQYVYWYGVEGSAHVMLVKVMESENSYKALEGRKFTVYTDDAMSKVAKGTILDNSGQEITVDLQNLSSGAGGAFFIGDLPNGRYYVKEENVTGKHFEFAVNGNGVISISDYDAQTTDPERQKTLELVNDQ